MIIILLVFQIIIVGLTLFTTHMIEHKFKTIQRGLDMYYNKRAYRTKANIQFIESVINEYNRLCSDTDEEPDLPSAIRIKLHKECIGRFSYDSIKNMALKTRHMMWGIAGLQCLMTWMNEGFNERYTLGMLFGSLLITLVMCLYGIVKGVTEKEEMLIDEITHYIKNVYPIEEVKRKNKELVAQKIHMEKEKNKEDSKKENSKQENNPDCISKNSQSTEKLYKESIKESRLNANDIAELLKSL